MSMASTPTSTAVTRVEHPAAREQEEEDGEGDGRDDEEDAEQDEPDPGSDFLVIL